MSTLRLNPFTGVGANVSANVEATDPSWNSLYKLGGAAAMIAVLVYVGLRTLGFGNTMAIVFTVPVLLALYTAHRRVNQSLAALGLIFCSSVQPSTSRTTRPPPCMSSAASTRLPPPMPRPSHHMKELREAELITEQKRGRWVLPFDGQMPFSPETWSHKA